MTVLYYSNPFFIDYDIELIKELQFKINLHYFLDISPYSKNATLLRMGNDQFEDGIYPFNIIEKYLPPYIQDYLDFERCHVLIRNTNSTFSISNLKLQFVISNFVKKLRCDVLHINNYISLKSIVLFAHLGLKKVLTFHDPIPHSSEINILNSLTKLINIKLSDLIILHNEYYLGNFIKRYNLNKTKVRYLPIGVYFFYAKRKISSLKVRRKQVLFFGRISKYKGLEFLVEAIDIIIKSGQICNLVIAGKGEIYFEHSLLKSIHCSIYNRYIPDEELAQLIQESSVIVCPYVDATQSGVVLTTYAFGKPVIATRVGGLPEMVTENKTGYLVDPSDSSGLANAILKIIHNTANIDFHKNIMNEYSSGDKSWSNISENLVKQYKCII